MIRTILFDLDETLYPPGTGVMEQIRGQILRYLRERLHLSPDEAETLQRHYFQTYGTTMRGLMINHHIDPDDFLHYVHNVPLQQYLRPNPTLDRVLASLPQQKVIFTNASREHAGRVLDLLGIRRHFHLIVDVRDLGYEGKPQPTAYRRICELLNVRPEECAIVEDNVRNLHPARALGMTTILVRNGSNEPEEGVDYCLQQIEEIGQIFDQTPGHSPASESCPMDRNVV